MRITTEEMIGVRVDRTRTVADPDDPSTLVEMFERAMHRHNKPNALNFKRDGEWNAISSSEMLERAHNIARGLYSIGVRRDDRVAIFSENCPEWTLTDAGCFFAAAIDVPIYATSTATQAAFILNHSEAKVICVQNLEKYDRIKDSLSGCKSVEKVVFFDSAGINETYGISNSELERRGKDLAKEQPDLLSELSGTLMPDDIATIIYTSGTTGEPKGVLLTHANIVSNLLDAADHHAFESDDIVLSVLPLSHVYERLAMYMFIDNGMTVYYAESFDKLGANFREVRPTVMTGVPRIFEKIFARAKDKASKAGRVSSVLFAWATIVAREYARLAVRNEKIPLLLSLKHKIADILLFKKIREAVGGRIRLFISGGAALPEELGLMLLGAGIPIVQGYGLTETSPVACAGVPENNRIATVGKPIPNVDIRVAGDGEIEVRGPNVMIGYYKNPEATRSVFTDDGWFKTGDIGMMDSEGYLRITDRKKELFKTSGGKYIAPAPIEQKIKGSRFVNQVVLIGNMRKFASALIVPDWEQLRSYAALKGINAKSKSDFIENPRILDLMQRQVDSLTQDLAQYEKVKRIALLENEFSIEDGELTPTLKVKRRIVDEKYKAVIDKLYEDAETERPLSAYSD